ncbi:hypothetical protein DEO72_LG8g2375 [Vigna unguiculata]|uniref:Uncharacterized protein n=1 Tax=Vigna unguiculata TaxID=3917 RepID=A0A4D6MW63_VIGUN|nr:hypothetical protein DEO72_LG8g2375 [Vigna unguiculata]
MSTTSSSGSNCGDSGASFVGLRDTVVKEALDADSRRVVEVLDTLPIRVPRKWVVCCYLTDNPSHDLCGIVMAHHAKKVGGEVDLFAKIRDKMANATKGEGQLQAPNLAGLVVDTYWPPVAKRPAPSKMKGVGKDRKRLRALAKIRGVGLLSDEEVAMVEAADPGLTMRAMSEYLAHGMVLSRWVATLLQEELAAGDRKKLAEEVAALKVQRDREHVAWADEKMKLEAEVKRLKVNVVGLEKKLMAKQVELDGVNAAKDATVEEAASEVFGLQQAVYNEHVNGFQKALRQAEFLYREVSMTNCRFNVNLDVYDDRMLDVAEIRRLKAEKEAATMANEDIVVATPPATIDGVAGEV